MKDISKICLNCKKKGYRMAVYIKFISHNAQYNIHKLR